MTPITTDKHGNVFLECLGVPEPLTNSANLDAPLTHALVVVRCDGNVLFVHDRWKDKWELPGGSIEPGESPRDCAVRELAEETGQCVTDLTFSGLMKFQLKPNDRLEYGALYAATLDQPTPFEPNDEIDRTILWDGTSDIPQMAEIDRALVDYAPPPQRGAIR